MWDGWVKLYNEKDMVRDGYYYALGLGAVAALLWQLTNSLALAAVPVVLALFFCGFSAIPSEPSPPDRVRSFRRAMAW